MLNRGLLGEHVYSDAADDDCAHLLVRSRVSVLTGRKFFRHRHVRQRSSHASRQEFVSRQPRSQSSFEDSLYQILLPIFIVFFLIFRYWPYDFLVFDFSLDLLIKVCPATFGLLFVAKGIRRQFGPIFLNLVNLALADEAVTVVCIPLVIGQTLFRLWLYGDALCKLTGSCKVPVYSSV